MSQGALADEGGGGSPATPQEDFSSSPFTEYGEFNQDEEEASDIRFYQYGRFFGVSLGLNYEGVTGNRGKLWEGGFPGLDFRLHYWFDFNFALDLGLYSSPHEFTSTLLGGRNEVTMTWVGMDLKYYVETKNLSSGVTFAGPYLLMGLGTYTKTQLPADLTNATPDKETKFGLSAGGGLEFAISPRKTYFSLDSKLHFVRFRDTGFTKLQSEGIPDLSGLFYTFTASILFTW